jgi:hypothetical protein
MHLQLRAGRGQRSPQPAGPERLTHSRVAGPQGLGNAVVLVRRRRAAETRPRPSGA